MAMRREAADHRWLQRLMTSLRARCRALGMVPRCSGTKVRGPLRARHRPSTLAFTGPPAHFAGARWHVRFGARRNAAHRGPLEASATDPRTDFEADEGSETKIPVGSHEPSNHDLSASSRNASDGTHRSNIASHRSPPDARGRRSFVSPEKGCSGRAWGTPSGAGKSGENGGRPPPFPGATPSPDLDLPRNGAERMVAPRPGVPAIGKPPHPRGPVVRRTPSRDSRRVYSRPFSGCGKAARTREVLRSRDQGAWSVP